MEMHVQSEDRRKGVQQFINNRSQYFVVCRQPFSIVSYYFLELNLMILVFICRRHITVDWGRDMGTIHRPTQISIQIHGWRHDHLVDQIAIGCMDSPTLWPKTCGWPVLSQPLGARNRYRASSLRNSRPHIAHLIEKYERLSADYEQLRQMVMDMRSQMGGMSAPPFWPYVPGKD